MWYWRQVLKGIAVSVVTEARAQRDYGRRKLSSNSLLYTAAFIVTNVLIELREEVTSPYGYWVWGSQESATASRKTLTTRTKVNGTSPGRPRSRAESVGTISVGIDDRTTLVRKVASRDSVGHGSH
jgi:hypothetical protein